MKNAITIGTFDGVHQGHIHLFAQLELLAARYLLRPLVLYFPLPPKTLMSPRPEMTVLTLPDEKIRLLHTQTMAHQPLDFKKVHHQTPEEFFNVLLTKYNMGALLIGPDFAFGKERKGDIDFLRRACAAHNLPFIVTDFYKADNEKISSSLIRKTLAQGQIAQSTALLGRPYELSGRVITGHKLGRKLGFPTANLDTGIYKILPLGVFAVKVRVGRKFYKGFCNIGFRPTVNTLNTLLPLVEVHIFDFHQSIYGRKITIWFVDKLRDETKFNNLEDLKNQLSLDKQTAHQRLQNINLV